MALVLSPHGDDGEQVSIFERAREFVLVQRTMVTASHVPGGHDVKNTSGFMKLADRINACRHCWSDFRSRRGARVQR